MGSTIQVDIENVMINECEPIVSPEVYPESFGAVGDGETNDEVAVQQAIDSLPATGGTVRFTRQYGIGDVGIGMSGRSNVTLLGTGGLAGFKLLAAPTVAVLPGGPACLVIHDCTNVRVSGLYIDGNGLPANPISINGCTECVIEKNTIVSPGLNAAIFATNNTRNAYSYNLVLNGVNESRGLWIGNTNEGEIEYDTLISGNRISNLPATAIACLAIGGIVSHNIVSDLGAGSGIIFPGSEDRVATGITCIGNHVRNGGYHGIQSDCMLDNEWSDNIVVVGNVLEDNVNSGIYAARVRGWNISGNICRNNGHHGILLTTAKRTLITGNVCEINGRAGVQVVSGTFPGEVEDIQLASNLCSRNVDNGLMVVTSGLGSIDTVMIANNLCLDNGNRGVMVADSEPGNITHVSIVGNTTYGNAVEDLRVDPTDTLIANNSYDSASLPA